METPKGEAASVRKNIVICLDGTGNEFGDANSNVIKLYQTLDLTTPSSQRAYYHLHVRILFK